jgi:response regulator NasT
MNESLRIAVADDEPDMRDYFQKILPRLGHKVVAAARDGIELVARCRDLQPDLVITDIKMPDMDGIDAAVQINQERPVPIILVSAYSDATLIERAGKDHILGYLVKPIKQADLGPTIALVMRRFEQFQALSQEAADLREALEHRQSIERAKGFLMKENSLDEQQAFQRLQELARSQKRKLVDVAKAVLASKSSLPPAKES